MHNWISNVTPQKRKKKKKKKKTEKKNKKTKKKNKTVTGSNLLEKTLLYCMRWIILV